MTNDLKNNRPYGVSILTAAGLVGLPTFFFDRQGITKAGLAAHQLGFGLQMLPLQMIPGLSEELTHCLKSLKEKGVAISSYEGRWGDEDWLHPWRHLSHGLNTVLAYYLLFPLRYSTTEWLCGEIKSRFPDAVAIDLGFGSAQEVSPNTNPSPRYWRRQAQAGIPLVIDTYHLYQTWSRGSGWSLLQLLLNEINFQLAAIQVQFRTAETMGMFLQDETNETDTGLTLKTLKRFTTPQTPVIIELTPGLSSTKNLIALRQKISISLDS